VGAALLNKRDDWIPLPPPLGPERTLTPFTDSFKP